MRLNSLPRWPLGGIYLRLTVSYFLVALVAVLAFAAYTSLSPYLADAAGSGRASPLDALGDKTSVPELASDLEQNPVDHDALDGWVWSALIGVRLSLGTVTLAEIRDASGQPLASFAAPGTPADGLVATPEAQAVLQAALAGDQQPADLHRTLADGQTVMAVPITTDERHPPSRVVGVFLAVCTGKSFPPTKVISYWLAPVLAQQPPNQDALRGWLQAISRASGSPSGSIAVAPSALVVQVLDAQGQPLASAVAPGVSAPSLLATAQAKAAIRGALAGHLASTAAMTVGSEAVVVQTLPVRAYDGHLLGALVVAYDPNAAGSGFDLQGVWSDFVNRLATGFLFLLLATLVATLSGALIALGLRRRLRRITAAADAWSRGELEVEARDRSRDELGRLARHLNAMAGQLRALLATRAELAVVEERNRLARDLHDSVKQHVFATALLVRSARKLLAQSPDAAALPIERLEEAEALSTETQAELATLIGALRPAALADKGLAAVLGEYTADWSRRTGIAAELRIAGERATPLEVEEALYRVAQEALANVARHSGARSVELALAWTADGQVELVIRDDGRGFDPAAPRVGIGLASMRERVEAMGGQLSIASGPGGTVIEARVPAPQVSPASATSAATEVTRDAAGDATGSEGRDE